MAKDAESSDNDFWDREELLAQRENALFVIEEELRRREEVLLEREAGLGDLDKEHAAREAILADRELTLRETEALLDARELGINTAQSHINTSELQALKIAEREQIQRQFDERESILRAAESALKEREAFVEESENTILGKGQQLQEWEAELAHLNDELKGQGS